MHRLAGPIVSKDGALPMLYGGQSVYEHFPEAGEYSDTGAVHKAPAQSPAALQVRGGAASELRRVVRHGQSFEHAPKVVDALKAWILNQAPVPEAYPAKRAFLECQAVTLAHASRKTKLEASAVQQWEVKDGGQSKRWAAVWLEKERRPALLD